tara:strand:+ start:5901 stop:6737 length:837 start_codon:yes stop_codon:yes gene_type:complete
MKTYELINLGSNILKDKRITSNRLDSEIILSHIMGVSRENLLINEENIQKDKIKKFKSLISKRSKYEPIAYITKNKEFRSSNFFVDKNSLIPRPETELLIDPIISIFKNKKLFFLDVGIGTGCIMFSILKELTHSRGYGVDKCKKTIKNAKKNLINLKLKSRAKLIHKPIDKVFGYKFDLIVSNPPYIVKRHIRHLSDDIKRYEPRSALDGGNDGLDVIRKVIYKSKNILKSNGILALEIGINQHRDVVAILNSNGFRIKKIIKDYQDNVRCIFSTLI